MFAAAMKWRHAISTRHSTVSICHEHYLRNPSMPFLRTIIQRRPVYHSINTDHQRSLTLTSVCSNDNKHSTTSSCPSITATCNTVNPPLHHIHIHLPPNNNFILFKFPLPTTSCNGPPNRGFANKLRFHPRIVNTPRQNAARTPTP